MKKTVLLILVLVNFLGNNLQASKSKVQIQKININTDDMLSDGYVNFDLLLNNSDWGDPLDKDLVSFKIHVNLYEITEEGDKRIVNYSYWVRRGKTFKINFRSTPENYVYYNSISNTKSFKRTKDKYTHERFVSFVRFFGKFNPVKLSHYKLKKKSKYGFYLKVKVSCIGQAELINAPLDIQVSAINENVNSSIDTETNWRKSEVFGATQKKKKTLTYINEIESEFKDKRYILTAQSNDFDVNKSYEFRFSKDISFKNSYLIKTTLYRDVLMAEFNTRDKRGFYYVKIFEGVNAKRQCSKTKTLVVVPEFKYKLNVLYPTGKIQGKVQLNAEIVTNDMSRIQEKGFILGLSKHDLKYKFISKSQSSKFRKNLLKIKNGHTYYYKAYVKVDGDIYTSDIKSFMGFEPKNEINVTKILKDTRLLSPLEATNVDPIDVTFKWEACCSFDQEEMEYQIQYDSDDGFYTERVKGTSYTASLDPNSIYSWYVKAYKKGYLVSKTEPQTFYTNSQKTEENDLNENEVSVGNANTQRFNTSSSSQNLNENNPTTSNVDIEMVFVKSGTFRMGSLDGESDEKPIHTVTLSSFEIGKYEVTQAQWKKVMGSNPSYFKGDNLPVDKVSWNDVQTFITKLNQMTGKTYRLPTEAEWEYAARGGNLSNGFTYSGSNTIGDVAEYRRNNATSTKPVGGKQANELGIYDMSGNVWEWCNDWDGDYNSSAVTNPQGPASGSSLVLRGGNWCSHPSRCRVAYRNSLAWYYRWCGYGFRLARSF